LAISYGSAYGGRKTSKDKVFARINELIRVPKIRLIDDEGAQLGVVETRKGIDLAKERGLDLVEVASNVEPPVCRIMDYAKYKYEQEKKRKIAKKKQHVTHVKEVRFKPKIEEHDYQVKLKHIKEFLEAKDKVRVALRFRGRENVHKEIGLELLNRVANDVVSIGEMESSPKAMGKMVIMTLLPKSA